MANNITDRCVGQGLRHAPTWIANYPVKPVIDAAGSFQGIRAMSGDLKRVRFGHECNWSCVQCVDQGATSAMTGGYDALSELVSQDLILQASTPEMPLYRHRAGMVLGEGARSRWKISNSLEREAPVLAEIVGYGFPRIIFISRSGSFRVGPRQAMERALLLFFNGQVDYINTGQLRYSTAAEGKAISGLFGVPVSSTKSMMGHSLGAAGAVGRFSVCLRSGSILPQTSILAL
jgi:3-oxoacyl-(acyl-carrier-protein) synthase